MSDASPEALVYIAYARADLARVTPVVDALCEHGINVYFASGAVPGAGNYVHESQQALEQASALVIFHSRAAAQSPWVEAETRAFQSRMARGGSRNLISVRLDATALPPALTHYAYVDAASAPPETVAAALATSLTRFGGAPATGDEASVIDTTRSAVPPFADDFPEEPWTTRGGDISEPEGAASKGASEPPPAETPAPPPSPEPERPRRTTGALPPPAPAPGAPQQAPAPPTVEQVTFTAYHPREMQPQQWQPLVVYVSLDTPAAMAMVAANAAERLAGKRDQFRPANAERSAGLTRGAKLRIIPNVPGFEFNPSYLDVTWQEDVQEHDFRMRAESAAPGRATNGVVQIFQGIVLRGEIPVSVFVGQAAARLDSPDAYAQAIARAYRRIFASYSHQDMPVVESCETAARTMGDQYLRDVSLLQSGQQWDPRLIQAINDADIFQLFWSKRAAASPFVEREWRHALKLLPVRPNFIRPVYWSRQLYPTPAELNSLHFQPLSLSSLGWGRLRAALYQMRDG